MAVDFPTFERPTNATSGMPSTGNSCGVPADATNSARENSLSGAGCIGVGGLPLLVLVVSRLLGKKF